MDYKLQIVLSLFGSVVSPKTITSMIDVVPFTALDKGERRPELNLPKESIWSVRSDGSLSTIIDQWRYIRGLFGMKWSNFVEISALSRVRITIVVDASARIPSIIIPPEMAYDAYILNSEIDVDCFQ